VCVINFIIIDSGLKENCISFSSVGKIQHRNGDEMGETNPLSVTQIQAKRQSIRWPIWPSLSSVVLNKEVIGGHSCVCGVAGKETVGGLPASTSVTLYSTFVHQIRFTKSSSCGNGIFSPS
jgi:hypothetical protein